MALLDSLVEQEALRRLPVSEHSRSLLPAVVEFPLGNAADLALVPGRDHSNVYPRLWELHGAGLVGCESLGATRGRSSRWWVTQKGLGEIGLGGLAWQQPWLSLSFLRGFRRWNGSTRWRGRSRRWAPCSRSSGSRACRGTRP